VPVFSKDVGQKKTIVVGRDEKRKGEKDSARSAYHIPHEYSGHTSRRSLLELLLLLLLPSLIFYGTHGVRFRVPIFVLPFVPPFCLSSKVAFKPHGMAFWLETSLKM
jgi:hypothetical protein